MTDRMKIEAMLSENVASKSYFRSIVLEDLLMFINEKNGNLCRKLYIPKDERDIDFMWEVLKEKLGYEVVRYDDNDYNPYYQSFCITIEIKR